jgi:hypothetical protein
MKKITSNSTFMMKKLFPATWFSFLVGKFGEKVAFFLITEFSLNPFKKNQLTEELIMRIDKARNK